MFSVEIYLIWVDSDQELQTSCHCFFCVCVCFSPLPAILWWAVTHLPSFPIPSAILKCGMDSGMLPGFSHTHKHWKFLCQQFLTRPLYQLLLENSVSYTSSVRYVIFLGSFYFYKKFYLGDLWVIFPWVLLKMVFSTLHFIFLVVFNWLQREERNKVSHL